MKKSEQTREKIIHFFVEQMKTKDAKKITVKEIAEGIGIQRSTFYQYFENVGELLESVKTELLDGMCFYRRVPGRMALDLTPLPCIEQWFSYCLQRKDAMSALLGEHGDADFRQRFQEKICEGIQCMMNDEGMPNDRLRPFCVELNYSIYFSLLKFALQTAGSELEMSAEKLAGLANNWRASAILAEQKQGIPISREDFERLYGKSHKRDILTEK